MWIGRVGQSSAIAEVTIAAKQQSAAIKRTAFMAPASLTHSETSGGF
jgi:hypothetical protein